MDITSFESYVNQESENNMHLIMSHIANAPIAKFGFIARKLSAQGGLTDRLIQHFENLEQYENCQLLIRLKIMK